MVIRSPWPGLAPPTGSICDAILAKAREMGSKPAFVEGETGRTLTYAELAEFTGRISSALAREGLQPGDAVALALPNCIEFVLAFHGTLRAGGWLTTLSPLSTPEEIEHQVRDSGARFLITVSERAALAPSVERAYVLDDNWGELLAPGPPLDRPRLATDLAVLPYSSGTTGKPKGVMLTHGNVVSNIRQLCDTGEYCPADLTVNMMPLYHVAGMNAILNSMLAAGATVVQTRRFDLESWLALNERYRATALAMPPPVVLAVTKSPLWDRFDLRSIRRAMSGAAPLGADGQQAFEARTGILLRQIWGMSEATAAISLSPQDAARRKFGSCGYLLPSCEARVVDPASLRDLDAGGTGELWLRGPQIMQGYWRQPQATADTLVGDGWMRTGDIGRFDPDGCVYLVDRMKELIKYNALQVAPAELEDVVQSHPAVLDAAVVGAPDEQCGEIPMAFVVLRGGASLTAEELMRFVAERVAPHKKVRAVEFIDQIPKSPTGKILRRLLRERARARSASVG